MNPIDKQTEWSEQCDECRLLVGANRRINELEIQIKRCQGALADAGSVPTDDVESGIRMLTSQRDYLNDQMRDWMRIADGAMALANSSTSSIKTWYCDSCGEQMPCAIDVQGETRDVCCKYGHIVATVVLDDKKQ